MRALTRKLLRDTRHLGGQVITVALVVACGVAAFVSMNGTHRALSESLDAWYARARFADLFVHLERAPRSLSTRLESLPGVAEGEARVVVPASLDVEGFGEPIRGQMVSLPASGAPGLGRIQLREGRVPVPGRETEVVISEAFARAHRLGPGADFHAVIEGKRTRLRVVGAALSPEFIFAVAPGAMFQDDARYGVVWMLEDVLASAAGMEGAFNDYLIRLAPEASPEDVRDAVDRLLAPYGGLGATLRERQLSHRFITQEIQQLQGYARIVPLLLLLVAAFLVNVVLARLVALQREQIAALKALGYTNLEIGLHFLWLVLMVVGFGAVAGILLGAAMGTALCGLYLDVFHFPEIHFRLGVVGALGAVLATLLTALAGALGSVWRAARLPPAEAMRPAAPPSYAPSLLERRGLHARLPPELRMVVRDLERSPWRLVFSSLAIALAVATLVVGRFSNDAIRVLMERQFDLAQREDVSVSFFDAVSEGALRELAQLPGVLRVEGLRDVPARLVVGPIEREVALTALPDGGQLRRVLDTGAQPVEIAGPGLTLSRVLAARLGVGPGDEVEVQLREGQRRVRTLKVQQVIDESFGLGAYLTPDALARLTGESRRFTTALLLVDPLQTATLDARLKELPKVASISRSAQARARFNQQSTEGLRVFTAFLVGFAATIAVGVIYNNARVALAVRSRDLATLRVLGFTRREISLVLFVESGAGLVLGLPLGMVFGRILAWVTIAAGVDTELFRIPVVVSPPTYAFAAIVTGVAGVLSALLVRRRLDHLDLLGVMKARD